MQKTKVSQSGFAVLHVVLILIVVAIVGFAGWYVYKANKDTSNTLNNLDNSELNFPEATPTPILVDETANWNDFIGNFYGTDYGFTFKFPKNWVLSKNSNENSKVIKESGRFYISPSTEEYTGYGFYVYEPNEISTETFIQSYYGSIEGGPSKISSSKIGDYTAYKFFMAKACTPDACPSGNGCGGTAYLMFQKDSSTAVSITKTQPCESANNILEDNILNKIALTFKWE